MSGQCTFEVIKIQMKPTREQRIYDNTLYFKLCTRLQVICVDYITCVPTTAAQVITPSMLLIDGAAVTSFVSAHVLPNQLELFDGLIERLSLLNWLISEHEVKLVS